MGEATGALSNLQTLARLLGGKVSDGQILCPGPGHSPADRSLSVKIDTNAPDGFVVFSHSGDDALACKDYVREKAGLAAFKANGHRLSISDDDIERAVLAAAMGQSRGSSKGKITAIYDYTDAGGALLYQVLRYEPKNFRQRRPDGNGGWIWKLDDRRVVYRWPELLKYPDATVFITEGEKDADRLAELELCATTVATGKWTEDCIKALAGRDIIILQGNDDAGRKKAIEAATALHGTANSIRVVCLPDLPDRGDVSDWLDANRNHAKKFIDVCFDVPLWDPADTKAEEPETGPAETRPALSFINISAWKDQPLPERQWTVKDRIPANNITLLSGEGSVGKSILSLQLAVAVALGRDWLGALPEPGPALVVCCEDDENELWRRLDLIFQHYGASYTDFNHLHVAALAGGETLMAIPDRNGTIKITKLFDQIREAACNIRPKLIVLDNAADIYGGNENDRAQVRQFIGYLRGMAMAAGAGILLTSHPSLTGINTGTGLSGSTAWNASVRSRLYFKRATTEKDEEPDPDLRVLEVMKSNYGPIGETIDLRWSKGLFVPVDGISDLERAATEQKAEQLFLVLLDQFNRDNDNVSSKRTARNYAPTIFGKEKQTRQQKINKTDLETTMRRLLQTGRIESVPYGSPAHGKTKLVACK